MGVSGGSGASPERLRLSSALNNYDDAGKKTPGGAGTHTAHGQSNLTTIATRTNAPERPEPTETGAPKQRQRVGTTSRGPTGGAFPQGAT